MFEHAIFDSKTKRRLSRVGVVDVGSNSVRLVIFDGAARSPHYFYNEKIMAALGSGVSDTGRLNPEGRARAVAALQRFQILADRMGIAPLNAVATAAVREAEDGPDFCAEVAEKTGIKINVITGKAEARLSAQGVLLGWPDASGIVCDIGGSSMELATLDDGTIGKCVTSKLGPLRLQSLGSKSERRDTIKSTLAKLTKGMERKERLYLVGGSWRAFARVDMERRGYPLQVMHEYRMTARSMRDTMQYLSVADPQGLRLRAGVSEARMALLPLVSEVLSVLLKTLAPKEIAISSYGIREGLLYQHMPKKLRRRDPLIEACRFAEQKDARHPGFGAVLYDFISPLFAKVPPNRQRLIQAACLLHDVNWRVHPDYRHEACFSSITQASLGGLTHTGRIFMGLALLHRYKNSRHGSRFEPLVGILTPEDVTMAEVLGKAMRLASMLSAGNLDPFGQLHWNPRKRCLDLHLTGENFALFGEVAAARYKSLADALQAEAKVTEI